MSRQTFICALAAIATQPVFAKWNSYRLENNWLVDFNTDDCRLEVWKFADNSKVKVFESDEHLLSVGRGDVDDINIMVAGNVQNFPARQTKSARMDCQSHAFDKQAGKFSFAGQIVIDESTGVSTDFTLDLSSQDDNRLNFNAHAKDAFSNTNDTNYFSMTYKSEVDEEIFGMGLQYSEWDFKGKSVPLISDEAGVGRGLEPITMIMDKIMGGQGGTSTTSYAPAAQYITNKQRGFIFDQTSIGIASFDEKMTSEMLYWHQDTISGTLLYGDSMMSLAQELSKTVGTMEALPEWSMQGAVIGIVGGQEFVDEKYALMKELELPMVGIWMQDWVGEHTYQEGTRLIWNWQLKLDYYYDWDNMVSDWAEDGVRPFIYINPYIQDTSEVEGIRQDQFSEGCENGYFVRDKNGNTLLVNSLSIRFAMVDFTNPEAWTWFKDIIKENLVREGRGAGWMHDFGEYLPFDCQLWDGSDPVEYHNKYPEDWAAIVKEALDEVENGDEIVYFMRAGTGKSAKNNRLYWMGDQLTTLDKYDGLQSALLGLMNGGVSGATIGHSDIGGYTSIQEKAFGITFLEYVRNQETLFRWIEMNTFSDPFLRSHPSNIPAAQVQIYDSNENILFFKKFVEIHVKLADYKMALMEESSTDGSPYTRSLMLHFEHDKRTHRIDNQFMLGENIMMAPVFKAGASTRDVYLPGPAEWKQLWTGEVFSVDEHGLSLQDLSCAMGAPCVFSRDTEQWNMSEILAGYNGEAQQVLQQ